MTEVTVETKKYELRPLAAKDVFLMAAVIRKIGVVNFKKCFEGEAIKQVIQDVMSENTENVGVEIVGDETAEIVENTENTEINLDELITKVGVPVAFEIAGVIFDRLPECENEIYNLLSALSGMKVAEIQKLPMMDFFEMIIDVIKKPEFKDFIKVASKLLK